MTGDKKFANSIRYINYCSDSQDILDLDFEVKVGHFDANLQSCQILDDQYYVKKDYFYCKDGYKLLKWKIEINNIESGRPTSINIDIAPKFMAHSSIAYSLIEGYIIDAMIHHFINEKGAVMVHASCASKNGKALLFFARGGGGKTSILLQLINAGFQFVSDNFSIISPGKKASGFIEPLNIFTYNLNDDIYKRMNVHQKCGLKLKNLLYIITNGYLKIFTRLNPVDIFLDKIEDTEMEIDSAFLLLPNNGVSSPEFKKISKTDLIEHIYLNQRLEFPYFDKYLSAYTYAFPNNILANHWGKYKENLANNLNNNSSFYLIEVPKTYTDDTFKKIMGRVEGNEGNI